MTAELALALPSVVLALGVVVCVAQVVTARLECLDAARAAARYAARGESAEQVRAVAVGLAPPGADVRQERDGDHVRVLVRARVDLVVRLFPPVEVTGEASAALETQP